MFDEKFLLENVKEFITNEQKLKELNSRQSQIRTNIKKHFREELIIYTEFSLNKEKMGRKKNQFKVYEKTIQFENSNLAIFVRKWFETRSYWNTGSLQSLKNIGKVTKNSPHIYIEILENGNCIIKWI